MRFMAVIEIYNGNPYVLMDAARAARLKKDWHKPMPVLIHINGQPQSAWSINMMPIGDGSFYLYLHGDVRRASGTKVGDTVTVDIIFDETYRGGPIHPMPEWFAGPLAQNPKAQQTWDELTPSRQKEILRYFSWLKSDEARRRNVEKALHVLSGREGRFMARTWRHGK